MQEVGFVINSHDFLVQLDGLPSVKVDDIVISENGVRALVSALYQDKIEVLILDEGNVYPGQLFKKLETELAISMGDFLIGRAINPLGIPIDGKGLLSKKGNENLVKLKHSALGIESREFISSQMDTGITLIDTLIPIGKGQKELVVGDAHSGKTDFLIDLIVNQKTTNTLCIYTSIGKPVTSLRYVLDVLRASGALSYTIVIAASSTETAPLIFLAPKTAFAVATYFQKKGEDVLLILDDLGNHAKIYREIALLGGRPPGRESYPGDIFYQHSHLMELAGKFKPEFGGGSITAIPVIEINLNDFTTFIPTNLMAMTDGHLMFKASLHNQGQRPAIDISLSVSRAGRQTQNRLQSLLSERIRKIFGEAESLETVTKFSAELPLRTQLILRQKEIIYELLKQEPLTFIPPEIQIILLGLALTDFFTNKGVEFITLNKLLLIKSFLKDPKLKSFTNVVSKFENEEDFIKLLESVVPYLNQLFSENTIKNENTKVFSQIKT